MSEDMAFLRGLLADPDDTALRLVYADWLEENGDPRAAFLRLEAALHDQAASARTAEQRDQLHQARRSLDRRWLAQVDRLAINCPIVRPRPSRVYGQAIPAFINNGTYFWSPVDVYADGVIYCWGCVDVPLFRGKLAEGWVVPKAEVGGTLSNHNLGQASVTAGEWERTADDLERAVLHALHELNPTQEGLLDLQGSATEMRNNVRYPKVNTGDANPYRVTPEGEEVMGARLPVLEIVADGYRLRNWLVYADGLTQLGHATPLMPIDTVAQMFEQGRLTVTVPAGAWVTLDGLGRFQAGAGLWPIKPGERVREAYDLVETLNGKPGAIVRCIEAYKAHRADLSPALRQALRQAYEAVPEHLRRFCPKPIPRILADQDEPE